MDNIQNNISIEPKSFTEEEFISQSKQKIINSMIRNKMSIAFNLPKNINDLIKTNYPHLHNILVNWHKEIMIDGDYRNSEGKYNLPPSFIKLSQKEQLHWLEQIGLILDTSMISNLKMNMEAIKLFMDKIEEQNKKIKKMEKRIEDLL